MPEILSGILKAMRDTGPAAPVQILTNFYLSLGGLVTFFANGGTLSELELRVLYVYL